MKISSIQRPFGPDNSSHRHNHRTKNPFYNSSAWRQTRNAYLQANPWCVDCAKEGKKVKATVCDHIVQVIVDDSKKLDWSNFQGLCDSHHNAKSAREKNAKYSKK